MTTAIGLMDGAFFVGRKEIVEWINATLELNIQKVEDTAFGAVACQLLDIMHPGVVPMSKVNWAAKQNFEFVHNYKILQTSFTKLHIDKYIDVDRLITARYMDNLEFMQWFKRYFEMHVTEKGDYDCAAQRAKGKGGRDYVYAGAGARRSGAASSRSTASTARPASTGSARPSATTTAQKENKLPSSASTSRVGASAGTAKPRVSAASTTAGRATKAAAAPSNAAAVAEYEAELKTLRASNEEQKQAYEDLRLEMEGLEKERDFYFDKLREVEILLQDLEDQGKTSEETQSIFKILYATAEGFEPVDEVEGEGEGETGAVAAEDEQPAADETY